MNRLVGSPCNLMILKSSPTSQFKSISSSMLSFLHGPSLTPYMTTGKTIALSIETFDGKAMSLLFHMLSRFVIVFLPKSKHLAVTICSDFGAPKIKSFTVSIVFSSLCLEVMGLDAMPLCFWMLCFKSAFSLCSFTFIKRLFSSSSLSAIRVVSFAYLNLLIFLPAILIPACESSSLAFRMMYSA